MRWINLTLRRGALPKEVQHAMMAKLTDFLMWWEKVPDTPRARSIMKGWGGGAGRGLQPAALIMRSRSTSLKFVYPPTASTCLQNRDCSATVYSISGNPPLDNARVQSRDCKLDLSIS
jgi:hypothetical protein